MPSLWQQQTEEIDRLEKGAATFEEWKSAAEASRRINSPTQMRELLNSLYFDDGEKAALAEAFALSQEVFHFGFESNFHALVFFGKDDKATTVVKW